MKIKYNVGKWIMWGYAGRVLYPFVLFRDSKVSDRLFRHELEHVYQIQKDGVLGFHARYLWYLIRYGYRDNPYEVAARAVSEMPLTPIERSLKDKGA